MCYWARAAIRTGNPCTVPALGWCTKLPQKWRPTGLETHLVSGRKWLGFGCILHLFVGAAHSGIDCTDMLCVTGPVRTVGRAGSPCVPCRLSVGAQNCTKNGGLSVFETHLVSAQKRQEFDGILHFFVTAAQFCSVSQGACGRSNRKSMYLGGSRFVPKIATKMATCCI